MAGEEVDVGRAGGERARPSRWPRPGRRPLVARRVRGRRRQPSPGGTAPSPRGPSEMPRPTGRAGRARPLGAARHARWPRGLPTIARGRAALPRSEGTRSRPRPSPPGPRNVRRLPAPRPRPWPRPGRRRSPRPLRPPGGRLSRRQGAPDDLQDHPPDGAGGRRLARRSDPRCGDPARRGGGRGRLELATRSRRPDRRWPRASSPSRGRPSSRSRTRRRGSGRHPAGCCRWRRLGRAPAERGTPTWHPGSLPTPGSRRVRRRRGKSRRSLRVWYLVGTLSSIEARQRIGVNRDLQVLREG